MTLFQRGINYIRYRIIPPHNMHTHPAERFYFREYMQYIQPYLIHGKSLLDAGCQKGRFTIPAVRAGMHVTATDIRQSFFRYIQGRLHSHELVEFRKESLETTCSVLSPESFDVVLCLELLYNLPGPAIHVAGLTRLAKPGGMVIVSHRTPGYYIYRFIRDGNFKAVEQILRNEHPFYNAQTPEELNEIYRGAGLLLQKIVPVGMFSGFGKDTFAGMANPGKLNAGDREALFKMETNPDLIRMFGNNARYWLVIAEKEA